jgi:predicted negative regulator of RcsB-dependent stress response
VRTTTRHQLKQDKFATTAVETYSWAVEHRNKLIYGGVILAVALVVVLGGWAYMRHQNEKAGTALGAAMAVYNTPVRPAGMPENPAFKSFASNEERARAAHDEFEKVANEYPHTKSGDVARYFAGVTAKELHDTAGAESDLKKVADSSDEDLASLAKLALAGLYVDTNKDAQAIDIYKGLIDHPTRSVAKSTAQLQLAEMYQGKNQPQEAAKIYEQIRKDDPRSVAAEIAAQNMGTMQQQ